MFFFYRKYPKYSSGPDYGGSGATNSVAGVSNLGNVGSNAVQKSRSYSNFDSLKRTDFSNLNTLGQVCWTWRPVSLQFLLLTEAEGIQREFFLPEMFPVS